MKKIGILGAVCLALLLTLPVVAQSGGAVTETEAEAAESGSAADQAAGPAEPQPVNEEELAINDTETTSPQVDGSFTAFSWWDFLRMFLVLGAVIAVIYGVFFVLKRMGNPKFQANNLINVLSTQNLQGNRSLHLVEVGNEVFLIGSAEGSVGLVSKIEDGETIDELRLYRSEISSGTTSFQQALRGIFNRGQQSESTAGEDVQRGAMFLQKQRERLKNL